MNKGQRAGSSAIKIEVKGGKSYFWCSCGKSSKQPFCVGSHKGSECKQTNNQPFCDGSHNKK